MGLQEIPTELQLHVFASVDTPRDRLSIARTCQKFHNIVEPILYSTFRQSKSNATPLLIIKLLEKPHLARHFTTFSVSEHDVDVPQGGASRLYDTHFKNDWSAIQPLLAKYLMVTRNNNPEIAALLSKTWIQNLSGPRNWHAVTAILLLLLPNLETIDIASHNKRAERIVSILRAAVWFQSSSVKSPFSFPRLSAISFGAGSNDKRLDLPVRDLIMILQMPSLRTFECYGPGDLGTAAPYLTRPIHVESLKFKRCRMITKHIRLLLGKCKPLKHLHLSHSNLEESPHFSPAIFFKSFDHLQHQLETLTLLDSGGWMGSGVSPEDVEAIPAISGFTKLHTLKISSNFLLERQILKRTPESGPADSENVKADIETSRLFELSDLPGRLAHLTVIDADTEVMIRLLTRLKLNELPNLKSIHVEFSRSAQSMIDDAVWPKFGTSFQERGITLSFNFDKPVKYEEPATPPYNIENSIFSSGSLEQQ